MKRIIIIVCALVLIAVQASAVSDLDIMVEGHNLNSAICGAMKIECDPEVETDKVTYKLSEGIHDVFFTKGDQITGFACICFNAKSESEFLAQCVTACYNFAGIQAGSVCYDVILSQFLFVRAGVDAESSTQIPGIMIEISKQSFGYLFMLARVK